VTNLARALTHASLDVLLKRCAPKHREQRAREYLQLDANRGYAHAQWVPGVSPLGTVSRAQH
jgi:hypothetical protein